MEIKCRLCGQNVKVLHEGVKDYNVGAAKDEFKIVYCDSCKLGFCWPYDLSDEYLAACYPSDYEPYKSKKGLLDLLQQSKYKQDIRKLSQYSKAHGGKLSSIYEIGAGRGEFLHVFKKTFPQVRVCGSDMSTVSVKNAEK